MERHIPVHYFNVIFNVGCTTDCTTFTSVKLERMHKSQRQISQNLDKYNQNNLYGAMIQHISEKIYNIFIDTGLLMWLMMRASSNESLKLWHLLHLLTYWQKKKKSFSTSVKQSYSLLSRSHCLKKSSTFSVVGSWFCFVSGWHSKPPGSQHFSANSLRCILV